MQPPKLSREFISALLIKVIPEYEEMLLFIEDNGGRFYLPTKVEELIDRLKIHNYPELYRGKETLTNALLLSFFPVETINELVADLEKLPEEEKTRHVEELVKSMSEATDEVFENIPDTPEKKLAAQRAFNDLTADEQAKAIKQAQQFMAPFIATFYATICMMVHGRKLADLVLAAEGGDDDAFCLAVQIDKRILFALPYFKDRYERATLKGETYFLGKLSRRQTSPLLRSKIRFKTLWLTFAVLDDSGLLDGSLKHREILDICDEAGVGGYKTRIQDVGSLSKRLHEYREFQQINQRSRH